MAKIDRPILLEIVRIVQGERRVPDELVIQKRVFSITYLEDHRQRLEEALRRQDPDRLNMLFGQLESKVKYQAIRPARAARPEPVKAAKAPAKPVATPKRAEPTRAAKRPAATTAAAKPTKKAAPKRAAARTVSRSKAVARPKATVRKSTKVASRTKKSKPARR